MHPLFRVIESHGYSFALTIGKLVSYVKCMRSNNACDVVVIDYMQLPSLSDSVRLSRQEQLKQI